MHFCTFVLLCNINFNNISKINLEIIKEWAYRVVSFLVRRHFALQINFNRLFLSKIRKRILKQFV